MTTSHGLPPKLKDIDRIRKRIYHTQRRSPKWKALDKEFKKKVKLAKLNFSQNDCSLSEGEKSKPMVFCCQKIGIILR